LRVDHRVHSLLLIRLAHRATRLPLPFTVLVQRGYDTGHFVKRKAGLVGHFLNFLFLHVVFLEFAGSSPRRSRRASTRHPQNRISPHRRQGHVELRQFVGVGFALRNACRFVSSPNTPQEKMK
jgi:hypothetical protein